MQVTNTILTLAGLGVAQSDQDVQFMPLGMCVFMKTWRVNISQQVLMKMNEFRNEIMNYFAEDCLPKRVLLYFLAIKLRMKAVNFMPCCYLPHSFSHPVPLLCGLSNKV